MSLETLKKIAKILSGIHIDSLTKAEFQIVELLCDKEIMGLDFHNETIVKNSQYNGSTCPHCQSENIIGENIEPEGASLAFRPVICDDCSAAWDETLEVINFGNLSVPTEAK